MKTCWVLKTKEVDYSEALVWQRDLFQKRSRNEIEDTLILLEHPLTLTLGRIGELDSVIIDKKILDEVCLYEVDRGGSLTLHNPGQLVGYPILDLGKKADVIEYLRSLEEVISLTAGCLSIKTQKGKKTGVWVNGKKLASIGVKVTQGVTMHGFSLNVNNDLSFFKRIKPCGLNCEMTSLKEILGYAPDMEDLKELICLFFSQVFDTKLELKSFFDLNVDASDAAIEKAYLP